MFCKFCEEFRHPSRSRFAQPPALARPGARGARPSCPGRPRRRPGPAAPDGRSLYPSQVFFPMAGEKDGWARLAKNLKAEIDEELIEAYRGTISLPFEQDNHKRVAVKIIDDRGIESLKIVEVG